MNHTREWCPNIRQQYYKIISKHYPDFETEKIEDIKILNNSLTFQYEGMYYICQNISPSQMKIQSISDETTELITSVMWREFFSQNKNPPAEIVDLQEMKCKSIIPFYFKNISLDEIDKLSFSNGYIIFHHAGGIKLCPDKLPHQINFENWFDILTQWIEISSIIQKHYPNVQNIDQIENLVTFDGNKILFHYQWCQYFCDMYSIEQIATQVKKAKEKENALQEMLSKPIKPNLQVVHSQK